MGRIAADQARALDPANAVAVALDGIYKSIEKAASEGKKSIRFPYDLTQIAGEGSVSPKAPVGVLVARELIGDGYSIKDHWDCSQFVDAYLTIEWGV